MTESTGKEHAVGHFKDGSIPPFGQTVKLRFVCRHRYMQNVVFVANTFKKEIYGVFVVESATFAGY